MRSCSRSFYLKWGFYVRKPVYIYFKLKSAVFLLAPNGLKGLGFGLQPELGIPFLFGVQMFFFGMPNVDNQI